MPTDTVELSSSSTHASLVVALTGLALGIAGFPTRALAQEAAPPPAAAAPLTAPPPPPPAGVRMVGGHIGVATPLVSFHSVGKGTQSISDQFTLAVPIGITVHLSPAWVFDFETIFANDVHPWGGTGFTVDPGVVYVGGPVALGLRVKFDAAAAANFGLIPLVHYALTDLGEANWFIEAAFPMTAMRTAGYSLGIVAHTGIAF